MKLQDLKGKSILILGFGREGKATLKFLKSHYPGKEIVVADQKDGKNYLDNISSYDVIIKSPGVPYLPEIKKAKDRGKIITSATSIFFENYEGTIIGVTGTKGKSTTASLIYEVLKQGDLDVYLIGNIGQPSLELLDKLDKDSIVVYELSSFQLEDLKISPHIAVITNIYPEHLDHHRNFESYKNAKANIVKFQKEDDYVIFNKDNEDAREIAQISKAKNKYGFSIYDWSDDVILEKDNPLIGKFNLDKIAPALYIGRKIFHLPDEKIKEAIINFKPLPHRLEFVGEFKGIKFYNDSLSTIPQATILATEALGKDVETLIAGGYDRGIDYSILGPVLMESGIKNLILFPTTGAKIWQSVCKAGPCEAKKFDVTSMEEAVKIAFKVTRPGKTVLLSPASSSFNMFKDYEDRGNQFKDWVKKLGSK